VGDYSYNESTGTIYPSYPKLIDDIDVIPMADRSLQFRGVHTPVLLKGRHVVDLIPRLLHLLDGTRTVQEIITSLPTYDRADILTTLGMLLSKGLLEDGHSTAKLCFTDEELTYYNHQLTFLSRYIGLTRTAKDRYEFQVRLKKSRVLLLSSGTIGSESAKAFCRAGIGQLYICTIDPPTPVLLDPLELSGINPFISVQTIGANVRSPSEIETLICHSAPDLIVVATSRPIPSVWECLNETCLSMQRSWIRMTIDGHVGLIGPTVIPFQTPCYICFATRLQANTCQYYEDLSYTQYLDTDEGTARGAELPQWSRALAELLGLEVMKLLSYFAIPATYGRVVITDCLTLESKSSKVSKLPRCPACSRSGQIPAQTDLERLLL
jgi:bacteriocin biosynthesis cyclodehydratase domain-containing protein